jgi:hypothetical protein
VSDAAFDAASKEVERAREEMRRGRWRDVAPAPERPPGRRDPRREYRNLYVPTPERVYIAPAMILHYVVEHRYRPPDEFMHALQQCPPQGSGEYVTLIEPLRSPFDPSMFDRAWAAEHEAAHRRSQQWVRRGMCPRCEFWQYLSEGDVAKHCGVPLVRLEDRDPAELRRAMST